MKLAHSSSAELDQVVRPPMRFNLTQLDKPKFSELHETVELSYAELVTRVVPLPDPTQPVGLSQVESGSVIKAEEHGSSHVIF
jgi:hypothetical protein